MNQNKRKFPTKQVGDAVVASPTTSTEQTLSNAAMTAFTGIHGYKLWWIVFIVQDSMQE